MPPKPKTEKELERQRKKIEYVFAIGIDLFSRYAFVKLWRVNKNLKEKELVEITQEPTSAVESQAFQEDVADDGKATTLGATQILEAVKEWYKQIEGMGFDNVRYFISDDGGEYKGQKLVEFLREKKTIPTTTIPNDRIKNPLAERFIGTFKRLVGQYMALKGTNDITQEDVDKIVSFYNNRIHSSTGYSPAEVLGDIDMKEGEIDVKSDRAVAPMLFDMYRRQKSESYLDMPKTLLDGSYVRVYNKWKTSDKNIGEKKSNIPNWSYSIYKVKAFNKSDNAYELELVGERDERDKKFELPSSRGMRREFLMPIDYEAWKNYSS